MDDQAAPSRSGRKIAALVMGGIATAIIPVNFCVLLAGWTKLFVALALSQLVLGIVAAVFAFKYRPAGRGAGIFFGILFILIGLGGPVGLLLLLVGEAIAGAGGAWGRPLRLRGRILHPELRLGSDWTLGDSPSVAGLDEPARRALEALWLHDAQKEHASVPAFSRLSWALAGAGAPAELIDAVHRAALEEIDHARRCFALAAGYGGRAHTAEPMPDLLVGGLDLGSDPLTRLAVESVEDGGLLEDFNADVAAACARACSEPVTRAVLEQIAREERSHAELSWRILAFCLERGGARTRRAVALRAGRLAQVARPTAVSAAKQALVAAADENALRRHGRLPDREWAPLWTVRVEASAARVRRLLANAPSAAAEPVAA